MASMLASPALRCRALSTTKPVGPVGAVGGGGAPELEEGDAYCSTRSAAGRADGRRREELRDRNAPFLTAAQFAEVCAETRRVLRASAATDGVGYVAFAEAANRFLDRPLEGGHLLDRVAMVANAQDRRDSEDVELGYLFAALSLCCGGDAVERAAALHRVYADGSAAARPRAARSSLDEDSHALTEEDFVVLMTAKAIDFKKRAFP
ncbi:hypothetical protein JL722_6648 [Aureococcus anophagefferens]|nr:hypothetical protein JL722_6648 [Aureococcus anophagefferens]